MPPLLVRLPHNLTFLKPSVLILPALFEAVVHGGYKLWIIYVK